MRILILGAGGVGGYFGGRFVEASLDVTFMVRPARAAKLAEQGLVVKSPLGDIQVPVTTMLPGKATDPFDLVVLTCKAYDLDAAIAAIGPAMGPDTALLPLLNGLCHFPVLDAAFGQERVLGGVAHIAATLSSGGIVEHLGRIHRLTFGERLGGESERVTAIATELGKAKISLRPSPTVVRNIWEKYVMLATLAGMTCLMRASVGEIAATESGIALTEEMLAECLAVSEAAGYPPSPESLAETRTMLTRAGSPLTASMLRDMEHGGRTEARHILGDMVQRSREAAISAPLLRAAWCRMEAYEARLGSLST